MIVNDEVEMMWEEVTAFPIYCHIWWKGLDMKILIWD